jgi:hypothetical protein
MRKLSVGLGGFSTILIGVISMMHYIDGDHISAAIAMGAAAGMALVTLIHHKLG